MNYKYRDQDWLYEQYVDEERTVQSLADECGVAQSTITRWMDKNDIRRRDASSAQLLDGCKIIRDPDWLQTQYIEQQRTISDIADECGLSNTTVSSWMDKYGIERRSQCDAQLVSRGCSEVQDEDWLRRQYLDKKKSLDSIADNCDVSASTVHRWLQHYEIETRKGYEESDGKYSDNGWLHQKYVKDEMSAYEIADFCDVSYATIYTWLNRHNISRRSVGGRFGEHSSKWKGGVTPLRKKIRNSTKYGEWRAAVFCRDNYRCQWCNDQNSGNLNADHIYPFSAILDDNNIESFADAMSCSDLWDIDNGRTLCKSCHFQTPSYSTGALGFAELSKNERERLDRKAKEKVLQSKK